METEVRQLKELIDKLRDADTEFRVFGADSHRYHIGPPLSETEILKFERKHNISLPADYRLYLQLVGNGSGRPTRPHPYDTPWVTAGAGPGYGLYALPEVEEGGWLGQPFPFEEEAELPYELPYDEWEDNIPGALEICTKGCSSHTHLIVNGPAFGTIWEGYEYDHFSPTHQAFTQWMRKWAERSLRVLANERLVDKLALGMSQEQVVAAVGGEWKERKNQYSSDYYFEAAEIPAQLVLSGENGVVTQINRWPFI